MGQNESPVIARLLFRSQHIPDTLPLVHRKMNWVVALVREGYSACGCLRAHETKGVGGTEWFDLEKVSTIHVGQAPVTHCCKALGKTPAFDQSKSDLRLLSKVSDPDATIIELIRRLEVSIAMCVETGPCVMRSHRVVDRRIGNSTYKTVNHWRVLPGSVHDALGDRF